jgi:hypothetical protein
MLAYKDFVPQVIGTKMLGLSNEYEEFDELLARVNRWIKQNQVDVVNVETLLLTEALKEEYIRSSTQIESQGRGIYTYQTVRVWYRVPERATGAYTGKTTKLR